VISQRLLNFYYILLPFKVWPNLSGFITKLTLADFLIIPIGMLVLRKIGKIFDRNWWTITDLLTILWLLLPVLSMLFVEDQKNNVIELISTIYLVSLYFSTRLIVEPKNVGIFIWILIISGFIWALIAICGWFIAVVTQKELIFVLSINTYPYLGNIYRAQALTGSPNMLLSFLMLGVLFCWARLILLEERRLIHSIIIITMLVGLLLTFSRDVLIVLSCMGIVYLLSNPVILQTKRIISYSILFAVFLLLLVYIFLSHFIIAPINDQAIRQLVSGEYIKGDNPYFTIGKINNEYGLFPSIYLELKMAALKAFFDRPILGVGGGNFNQYLSLLKSEGQYPSEFTEWDPHSTYLGTLAEHGWIGFLIVCGIIFSFCWKSIASVYCSKNRDFIATGLVGVFIAIAFEAICVDVMHFRQYWIIFALGATYISSKTD
jgi:hypothetical protein